ncbi:YggT family protein [Bacillus sp. FSL W7-1360]|nr:YggT family protein [Shouchella lonarensis]
MIFIFSFLHNAFWLYTFALLAYILMSWFPNARETAFGQILGQICEPYLAIFRSFIPPLGMIDLSPLVGILALRLASNGLIALQNMILSLF